MMRFEFTKNMEIPKLSWCLKVTKNNPVITVSHGSWVEVDNEFFVEGAWDGDFKQKNIHQSLNFMGSGGLIEDNKLIISSSCNTIECIYSIKKGKDTLFLSNSIAFILEAAGEDLDIKYIDYENDILSISDGLSKYKKHIPTKSGNKLFLNYFCNIEISQDLQLNLIEKQINKEFLDFNEYYNYLLSSLRAISENMADVSRKKQYTPIVFSSNGYDSAACAALGKEIGCNEAVVYESKRAYRSDSGKPVVEALKYEKIIEKEELDYKKYNTAHEFVATGELGTSIFFAAAEKELEGKFLLSGVHGDKIWDREYEDNPDLVRSFYPDTAKTEFRLRVGFIKITIPFFSVKSHSSINKISNLEEMKPWTLGNDYDRPIPRRILEEKGVPRESFGFKKGGGAGSSLRFASLGYLSKVMPRGSFDEFKKYYKENKVFRIKSLNRYISYSIYCLDILLQSKKINILEKIFKIESWQRKYKCSPWAPSYLFHWGTSKLRKTYGLGTEAFDVKKID